MARANETSTVTPDKCSSLLVRMSVLARLIERSAPHEPRRRMLERLLRQMRLFSRMSERLEIAAPETPLMRAVLREAELGCLDCSAWRHCRRWLDGHEPQEDYRDFCPNEGLFSVLPQQKGRRNRPRLPE
jgi:uncharacterized protein DUF6455